MATPSISDMVNPSKMFGFKFRAPRPYKDKNGETKYDNPRANYQEGALKVVIGGLALAFAARSLNRTRLEKSLLLKMWEENMTIKKLKEISRKGNLPSQVLLRGNLASHGAPVKSLASECSKLIPFIGKVNQPENLFLRLGSDVLKGKSPVPTKPFFEKYGIKHDDIEVVEDDFSMRETTEHQRDIVLNPDNMNDGLIISETFITRLGCEARQIKKKDKPIRYERDARKGRFNVFHHRRVSDGLYFIDDDRSSRNTADIELPEYGIRELETNDSPSLFLSVPDPMKEFKKWLSFSNMGVANADKSLTHLSKFIHIDQSSRTDDGRFIPPAPPRRIVEDKNKNDALSLRKKNHRYINALDEIGRLVPNGWMFHPNGFYDNNPGSWSSFKNVEEVNYTEFKRRIAVTNNENSRHQEYTYWGYDKMKKKRDSENCFRIVELGIPNYFDVVILARPIIDNLTGDLKLVPPAKPNFFEINEARFYFRILCGKDNIDNLMKHRNASLVAYLGFALMGIFTIIYGEEIMRDALVEPLAGGGGGGGGGGSGGVMRPTVDPYSEPGSDPYYGGGNSGDKWS